MKKVISFSFNISHAEITEGDKNLSELSLNKQGPQTTTFGS